MQGWRLEMEDAHISADFPSKPDHLLLVIPNLCQYPRHIYNFFTSQISAGRI